MVRDATYLIRQPGEGEQRWVHPSGMPLCDAAGQVTDAVLVFTDITRERLLVRDLPHHASCTTAWRACPTEPCLTTCAGHVPHPPGRGSSAPARTGKAQATILIWSGDRVTCVIA